MIKKTSIEAYRDIIDLEHPISKRHPQMSMRDRAAQFSPFAALTGHSAAIEDTARRETDKFHPEQTSMMIGGEEILIRDIIDIDISKKE